MTRWTAESQDKSIEKLNNFYPLHSSAPQRWYIKWRSDCLFGFVFTVSWHGACTLLMIVISEISSNREQVFLYCWRFLEMQPQKLKKTEQSWFSAFSLFVLADIIFTPYLCSSPSSLSSLNSSDDSDELVSLSCTRVRENEC